MYYDYLYTASKFLISESNEDLLFSETRNRVRRCLENLTRLQLISVFCLNLNLILHLHFQEPLLSFYSFFPIYPPIFPSPLMTL